MFDYLSLDWGSFNVGVAFGDSSSSLVIPSTQNFLTQTFFVDIAKEIKARNISKIVVGLPSNFRGKNTHTSLKAIDFAHQLQRKFPNIEVVTWGENCTTKDSKKLLCIKNSKKLGLKKFVIDNQSAAEILKNYLSFALCRGRSDISDIPSN